MFQIRALNNSSRSIDFRNLTRSFQTSQILRRILDRDNQLLSIFSLYLILLSLIRNNIWII